MRDVMVDLETLGQTPGCAIFAIGAVAFDPETGEIDDQGMHVVINVASAVCAGLRFDEGTLDFWGKQGPEARAVLKQAWRGEGTDLRTGLSLFKEYVGKHGGKEARVWGNGSDFDNAILTYAFRAVGMEPYHKFWNHRCYRTLKALHPEVPLGKREGVYHNALDDAKTQAIHALQIFGAMRGQLLPTVEERPDDSDPGVTIVDEEDLVG